MKVFLVLSALVAVGLAAECNIITREKVRHQWQEAYHHNRAQFGVAVWRAFFAQDPKAKELFTHVGVEDLHSPAFTAHSARVLGGLDTIISSLDSDETLNAELAHLKTQHDDRNIPDVYYRHMYQSLERVMSAMLGPCFDYGAWDACGDIIFAGITGNQ